MTIQEHVSLTKYSTMRLGGEAKFLCEIRSEEDLEVALNFAKGQDIPFKVIGSGSNLIWSDTGFKGIVIVNKLDQFKIDGDQVTIGGGMDWDAAVEKTVMASLSGIELLSLIPGSSGATPVQNVGAYGREISDVLIYLRAYDTKNSQFITIANADCEFGYRSSRFNQHDAGRFIIVEITLQLSHSKPKPPFYESLARYLEDNNITDYTSDSIRQGIIAVRTSKLPDPDVVANNGSFFANPLVSNEVYAKLQSAYPDITAWDVAGGKKLSAAWLIEHAGFKDFHDQQTGMATWHKQPLVLINEHARSTRDLINFKEKIIYAVDQKFSIRLKQEPELVD